jgi:hypothetical protein
MGTRINIACFHGLFLSAAIAGDRSRSALIVFATRSDITTKGILILNGERCELDTREKKRISVRFHVFAACDKASRRCKVKRVPLLFNVQAFACASSTSDAHTYD